ALAQQYYGVVPTQPIPVSVVPAEPVQTAERDQSFEHPALKQTRVMIGFHIPSVTSPDLPPLMVLESALAEGHGSLLESAWVNGGMSVNVRGHVDQRRDPGLFTIETDLQPGVLSGNVAPSLDQQLALVA